MQKPPIQIAIKGLDGARRLFRKVREIGEDPQELLHIAGGILEAAVRTRFDTGKGPFGVPWPISNRAARDGGKTLVDTGGLEGSIRHEVRPGVLEIGVDALTESAKNAKSHQFGVSKTVTVGAHSRNISQAFGVPLPSPKSVNVRSHSRKMAIPARPFLGVDDDDRRDVKEAWKDHLRSLLNG